MFLWPTKFINLCITLIENSLKWMTATELVTGNKLRIIDYLQDH